MQDPRIKAEEIDERIIFDSTAKAITCGWEIAAGSSIDPNTGLNLSAEKQDTLDWFWENGGSIRLRIRPNDTDSTFRRFFFMGIDTNFKIQLGLKGDTGGSILEIRDGSGNNYYTANQTLTIGDFNELLFVWDPSTPSWTSYLNGAGAVTDTVAGAAGWGAYDTDYGKIKIGQITGGSTVTDMNTYQIDLSRRMYTAEEATDLFRNTTFDVLDDSKALVSLPLVSNYNDGADQVTENIGSTGGTFNLGDGTTSSTFPTQLAPHGMSFDGTTDYIDLGTSASYKPGTGDFSCLAWVRVDKTAVWNSFIGDRNGGGVGSQPGWVMAVESNSPGKFSVILEASDNDAKYYVSPQRHDTGQFVCLAFTWSNSGDRLEMYADGVKLNTTKTSNDVLTGKDISVANNANIGRQPSAQNYTNGDIGKVRIFDSELTETQVKWLCEKDLRLINV